MDDTNDLDGDAATDKYVLVAWADIQRQWPNEPLPLNLLAAGFSPVDGLAVGTTSTVRFTDSSTSQGYELLGQTVTLVVAPPVNLDVDANGEADALTDGVLILRYLFGLTGDALVEGVIDPGGDRTDPAEIADFPDNGRDTMLDVDANGEADALTDGIVILRYLFGFTGTALTEDAIDLAGRRTDPAGIEAFLDQYNPELRTSILIGHPTSGFPAGGLSPLAAGVEMAQQPLADDNADLVGPLAVAFGPTEAATTPTSAKAPSPIDYASGKYESRAKAVDRAMATADFVEPADPFDDIPTIASKRTTERRSASDLALQELLSEYDQWSRAMAVPAR